MKKSLVGKLGLLMLSLFLFGEAIGAETLYLKKEYTCFKWVDPTYGAMGMHYSHNATETIVNTCKTEARKEDETSAGTTCTKEGHVAVKCEKIGGPYLLTKEGSNIIKDLANLTYRVDGNEDEKIFGKVTKDTEYDTWKEGLDSFKTDAEENYAKTADITSFITKEDVTGGKDANGQEVTDYYLKGHKKWDGTDDDTISKIIAKNYAKKTALKPYMTGAFLSTQLKTIPLMNQYYEGGMVLSGTPHDPEKTVEENYRRMVTTQVA